MSSKHTQTLIVKYLLIILGSAFYGVSTLLFIFPHSLLLGGTSGISVIFNFFLSFSPSNILMVINFSLIIIAFWVLGKGIGLKTLIGSSLTTVFVGFFEKVLGLNEPIIQNPYVSAVIGSVIIAISSGIMFFVRSSSGGTDVIALIIQNFQTLKLVKRY